MSKDKLTEEIVGGFSFEPLSERAVVKQICDA